MRMENKRYLNIKEASTYMGVSRWTLYDLAGRGEIPPIKLSSKMLRFDVKDIDRYMEKKKIKNLPSRVETPLALSA